MKKRYTATAATAVLGLSVASLAFVAAPTQADPGGSAAAPGSSAACPEAFPADDLVAGQAVTGLTSAGVYRRAGAVVDSSTTPEQFTGHFLSVVEDNGVGDILIMELEGSRITRPDGTVDAGIWAGMSGSPVYASDGRLIGAVAYGFSDIEGSNFAGVTPANRMYDQLGRTNGAKSIASRVPLTKSEQRTLVRKGVSSDAAARGLRRLDPTLSVAGGNAIPGSTKLKKAGTRSTGGAGRTQSQTIAVAPGSNVSFAASTGSLSLFTSGTATAVCGDEVLAYGHPAGIGEGRNTMHGGKTAIVQKNGGGSYKLTNLAAPVGAQSYDGMNGVNGKLGESISSTKVVINTRFNGGPTTSTTSSVSDSYWTSTVAAEQTMRDLNQAMGAMTHGSAKVTIAAKYLNGGKPGSFTTNNTVVAREGLPSFAAETVFGPVETLAWNDLEKLELTQVTVTVDATDSLNTRALRKLEVFRGGAWRAVPKKGMLRINDKLRKQIKVRVTATSLVGSTLAPTSKVFTFRPGRKDVRVQLMASTGFTMAQSEEMYYDEEYAGPTNSPTTVAELMEDYAPVRQDQVSVLFMGNRSRPKERTWTTGGTVTGTLVGTLKYPKLKKAKKKTTKAAVKR